MFLSTRHILYVIFHLEILCDKKLVISRFVVRHCSKTRTRFSPNGKIERRKQGQLAPEEWIVFCIVFVPLSLFLSFSRPLSENRPQNRELTTNNYRLKFPRNKVSLDNILGAMSLCFSASGFIEYRRLDVSLSSKEPQYVFELFRIARIFSLYSYSSNPSSPVSIFLSFKSRESMSQYDESLISYS